MIQTRIKRIAWGGKALAFALLVSVVLLTALSVSVAGTRHAAATSGQAFSWGRNSHSKLGDGTTNDRSLPEAVSNLTNVRNIDGGDGFTLAVRSRPVSDHTLT